MALLTQAQHREQLREAFLRTLAASPSVAFPLPELSRRARASRSVDAPFDDADALDSLALLQGLDLVKPVRRPLSGLSDWQITSAGVLFVEQNYA